MSAHVDISIFRAEPQEWMQPTWLVLDAETTGLDPKRHSMWQVSALAPSGEGIEVTMRPRLGAELDPKALGVTGASLRSLEKIKLGYYDGIAALAEWILAYMPRRRKIMLCGINPASLDLPFLTSAFRELEWWKQPWLSHRTRDLANCAIDYAQAFGRPVPEGGFETDEIYQLLELQPEPRPHIARNGVMYEARAFGVIHTRLQTITASAREQI